MHCPLRFLEPYPRAIVNVEALQNRVQAKETDWVKAKVDGEVEGGNEER